MVWVNCFSNKDRTVEMGGADFGGERVFTSGVIDWEIFISGVIGQQISSNGVTEQ